jgi:transglutaminase-like putative cysteine protease
VLGAPLRLDAPDVSGNQIILTYTVLDGPIVTPPLLGATLDTFDGTTWTQGPGAGDAPLHGTLPAPKGAQSLTVRITVYALPQSDRGTYMLGFDQARAFSVPVSVQLVNGTEPTALSIASWEASQPIRQGASYTVESTIVTDDVAAAGTIPADELQRLLQLPAPVDPAALHQAQQWIGTAAMPRGQAEALLDGLAKDITYDATATPPAGVDVVTWTLQNRRANATALTTTYILLGRALGLPLRLAEGYLPGHFDPTLKQMVVRGADAAVWAQLAVPGVGWLDLFPASDEVTIAVPSKIVYKGIPTPTPLRPTPISANKQAQQRPGQRNPTDDQQVFGESGWLLPLLAAGVVLLLALAALGVMRWRWSRFGAQFAPLGQFFARVGLLARLGGISLRPSDTSTQATGKVVAVVPGHRDTLMSLNGTYERVRYGPPHAAGPVPNLREQWRRLSGALWRLVLTRPWRRGRDQTQQSRR